MDTSDDRTLEIAQRFPVKVVRVDPQDYNNGKTRNEGAAMMECDLLIFLSTDIEITDNQWLSKLTRHFSDPQVAAVYGRQIPKANAQPMERYFMYSTYPPETEVLFLEGGKLNHKKRVWFSNVNSAVRYSVWQQIKLPEMLVSEDLEWATRTMKAGYKIIYDSEATVLHSHNRSIKGIFKIFFTYGSSMPVSHANSIIDFKMKDFIKDGLSLVYNEYAFMIKNGYWYWIPYAILCDMTKALGTFIGTKQKYIPVSIKRVLGERKYHWDKYDDIIKEPS